MTLDRSRLASLIERERGTYAERHPKSRAAFEAAQRNLFGGVPMTWMGKWAGGFPLYLDAARREAGVVAFLAATAQALATVLLDRQGLNGRPLRTGIGSGDQEGRACG